MKEEDYGRLTALKIDPFFYSWNGRQNEFELDYQIASLLKKYSGVNLGIDREEAAFSKWKSSEESCRRVNQYFRERWCGGSKPLSHPLEEILFLSKRKITALLGTVKARDLDRVRDGCRHGPGGDLSLAKRHSSAFEKYRTPGTITQACLQAYDIVFGNEVPDEYSLRCVPDRRLEIADHALIVRESKLSFVPKTARIDRAICIEPRWNVYIQLGLGELLAERLRRHGIDLKDQSLNQRAAADAYDRGFATLDLSSASDSIATNLVIDLLADADPIWLELLLLTRCTHTKYRGETFRLEKISSMGNGYTFPLESLIFYALSWATARYTGQNPANIRVYGDDIIAPRACASQLIEVLNTFGFSVNTDKSYVNGDFFESCGTDYMCGREVRPFFVTSNATSLLDLYVLHNQVVAWAGRGLPSGHYSRARLDLCKHIVSEIPKPLRLWGPPGYSGLLHSSQDVWGPYGSLASTRKRTSGWDGYFLKGLKPKAIKSQRFDYLGHLYSKLHGGTQCGNWVTTPGTDGVAFTEILVLPNDFWVVD
jgi:hypothetical protein